MVWSGDYELIVEGPNGDEAGGYGTVMTHFSVWLESGGLRQTDYGPFGYLLRPFFYLRFPKIYEVDVVEGRYRLVQ